GARGRRAGAPRRALPLLRSRAVRHRRVDTSQRRVTGSARMRRMLVVGLAVVAGCAATPRAVPAGPARRVISLAPSVTEIVYALGAGDRLIGVCGQCDHPAAARALPRVGGYLAPSVEAVLAAQPDLVIAVPSPGNREAVRSIERAGLRVLVVGDRRLTDV